MADWAQPAWHWRGAAQPALQAVDVRLFRYAVAVAREKGGTRPLSDGTAFLPWFAEGLRLRFPVETEDGHDVASVLHAELLELLTEGHPVKGPWGHLSVEDGVVMLHSTREGDS